MMRKSKRINSVVTTFNKKNLTLQIEEIEKDNNLNQNMELEGVGYQTFANVKVTNSAAAVAQPVKSDS